MSIDNTRSLIASVARGYQRDTWYRCAAGVKFLREVTLASVGFQTSEGLRALPRSFAGFADVGRAFDPIAMMRARAEAEKAREKAYRSQLPESMRDLPNFTHRVCFTHGSDVARRLLAIFPSEERFEIASLALKPPPCLWCKEEPVHCSRCNDSGLWLAAVRESSAPSSLSRLLPRIEGLNDARTLAKLRKKKARSRNPRTFLDRQREPWRGGGKR